MSNDVTVRPDAELSKNLDAMKKLPSLDIFIGTNLTDPPYPFFLEFGTSRMSARPAGRPAFEEKKVAAIAAAASVLREQFRRKNFTLQAMEAAGTAGGEEFRNRWAQLAAVETGTYRRSIHIELESRR